VFGDRDSGFYLYKFPGRRSSDTSWSRAGRHPTIQVWSTIGPDDAGASSPRWVKPRYAFSWRSADVARYAGTCCCMLTANHTTRTSGNSGSG
jgi:hypothetical protein